MAETKNSALPPIVGREEWLRARKELLAKEKAATKARDALAAQRRRLPMVKIEKEYVFEGPNGKVSLLDVFEGRKQLYVHHFMWIDERDAACPSCSSAADLAFNDAHFAPLHERDLTFVAISRGPWAKLDAVKKRKGWTFPFYSSHGTDFNYDFHVTLDPAVAPLEYNYRNEAELLRAGFSKDALRGDWPGASVFLRDGNTVYHTYSAYARGQDHVYTPFNILDLTPYGRQQEWEDSPEGWPRATQVGAVIP